MPESPIEPNSPSTDTFMGHWFGDWNNGIDHLMCGHCGLHQHAYCGWNPFPAPWLHSWNDP